MSDLVERRQKIPGDDRESVYAINMFLTDAQLKYELEKCEYCLEKPCKEACPCDCSPADFIRAAEAGQPSDYLRSAALIMGKNPLGGICGQTCPEKHCMAACVHTITDSAVNIPAVQATIVEKAKRLGVMPEFKRPEKNGKSVAVIGAGPAGLAAAVTLAQFGYRVTIFERENQPGGMCNLIPDHRLDKKVLRSDIDWSLGFGLIELKLTSEIKDPQNLIANGFQAVVVSTGLWIPLMPGIPNQNLAVPGIPFLKDPEKFGINGRVAVIGGGATAFDCAMTALIHGAEKVELFALENISEMPLTGKEMAELIRSGIDINGRIQIIDIISKQKKVSAIVTRKVRLKEGCLFSPRNIIALAGSEGLRNDFNSVIIAIGARAEFSQESGEGVFFAGDCQEGPSTVVEASAAGKNVAIQVDAYLKKTEIPRFARNDNGFLKSRIQIPGYDFFPVSLESEFFGRKIHSPFFLSASPLTDGLDQVKRAYDSGWAGVVIKTAFDNIPIHIPADYMYKFSGDTFANCDNVSDHTLDLVSEEIADLVRLFPDRMTIASTGGPLSGNDAADKLIWQNNSRKLEQAGAMAVEFSLSCPQGGDGTEGDIVSQNARLTQKIVRWILESGGADIPKLFKLTGAVTSIEAIGKAIKEVFDEFPGKKAGITLANTFPTLAFRHAGKKWEKGVIVGMAGEGVLNISYLTLARVSGLGLTISGNGGVMNYMEAANFLALGCKTVQFCSLPTKMGTEIIFDLESGLSHFMSARGINSIRELSGIALPDPITDFMDLPGRKRISQAEADLCVRCGNCLRCPYLAVCFDQNGLPQTDPEKCIGCKMCNYLCFTGAMKMRDRTRQENL